MQPWNPRACSGNPSSNILAERLEVLVVNARHVKAVPGRKTDVADREWLADLLQHGLLRASFIPDRAQRDLRDLTRTRTSLIDERSRTVRRLQKVLEGRVRAGAVADGPALSTHQSAGAAVPRPCSVSSPRSSIRACRSRTRLSEVLHRAAVGVALYHVTVPPIDTPRVVEVRPGIALLDVARAVPSSCSETAPGARGHSHPLC